MDQVQKRFQKYASLYSDALSRLFAPLFSNLVVFYGVKKVTAEYWDKLKSIPPQC